MYLEFENINFIIIIVFTLYQVQLGRFQRENPHIPWYYYIFWRCGKLRVLGWESVHG